METRTGEPRQGATREHAAGPETKAEARVGAATTEARRSVRRHPSRVLLVLGGVLGLVLAGVAVTMANLFLAILLLVVALVCFGVGAAVPGSEAAATDSPRREA